MAKIESEIYEPKEPEKVEAVLNPLDEVVDERRYTRPNVDAHNMDFSKPIDEPRFTPPPLQPRNISTNTEPRKREPINPEMKNIPKKETEMAAAQAAALIIQGYEWAHDLANKGLLVTEKKLNKLQAEGEINLNAMIDYDYGNKIRAGDFFQDYNKQVDGLLKVSDEFKEEVKPVLERVLAKRGIGLTDEQYLIYLFGKDIAAKSMIFFQQKAQLNYMIDSIKQATTAQYVPQAPPRPSRPPSKPEPPTEQPESKDDFSVKEPEEKAQERRVGRPRKRI
ncbi:MAG: hypothetical protein FJZ56_02715 [Chlamydiae bacterium]|nr:hypothetical protein [Chlamydiota bacterium]